MTFIVPVRGQLLQYRIGAVAYEIPCEEAMDALYEAELGVVRAIEVTDIVEKGIDTLGMEDREALAANMGARLGIGDRVQFSVSVIASPDDMIIVDIIGLDHVVVAWPDPEKWAASDVTICRSLLKPAEDR